MHGILSDNDHPPMKRRRFFGYLLAGAAGGLFIGTVMRRLTGRKKSAGDPKGPVRISVNPLAVPRRKEGSKLHV